MLLTVRQEILANPLSIAIQSLLKTDTLFARNARRIRVERSHVLNGITPNVEVGVPAVEGVGLPHPGTVLEDAREVVVMLNSAESELILQGLLGHSVVAE